jgi:hypothetical protein
MAKKLFKNYTFEFDANEKKIITSFCKQAINQMMADERFAKDVSAFESISQKLNSGTSEVKLTKDEKVRLARQLEENVKFIEDKMSKAWFIKKWFYKSMFSQYQNLLNTHFRD